MKSSIYQLFFFFIAFQVLVGCCNKEHQPIGSWSDYTSDFIGRDFGLGTKEKPFLISTAAELAFLAKKVNKGNSFHNTYFRLTNNIDLKDHYWQPIGIFKFEKEDGEFLSRIIEYGATAYYGSFQGHFDGGGFTIRNIYIKKNDVFYAGLFGYLCFDAYIQNLKVENIHLEGLRCNNLGDEYYFPGGNFYMGYAGGLVGYINYDWERSDKKDSVVIDNCHLKQIYLGDNFIGFGGLVGGIYAAKTIDEGRISITNCNVESDLISSISEVNYVGGLIGYLGINSDFGASIQMMLRDCNYTGMLSVSKSESYLGGMIAFIYNKATYESTNNIELIHCNHFGNIISKEEKQSIHIGGGIGGLQFVAEKEGVNTITLSNCTNQGDILVSRPDSSLYVGGLIGSAFLYREEINKKQNIRSLSLLDCRNEGSIKTEGLKEERLGSLIGSVSIDSSDTTYFHIQINSSISNGLINGSNSETVPLIGYQEQKGNGKIIINE